MLLSELTPVWQVVNRERRRWLAERRPRRGEMHRPRGRARACRRADWQFLLVARSWRRPRVHALGRDGSRRPDSQCHFRWPNRCQCSSALSYRPRRPVCAKTFVERETESAFSSNVRPPRWIVHAETCRLNAKQRVPRVASGNFVTGVKWQRRGVNYGMLGKQQALALSSAASMMFSFVSVNDYTIGSA